MELQELVEISALELVDVSTHGAVQSLQRSHLKEGRLHILDGPPLILLHNHQLLSGVPLETLLHA